MSDSEFEELMNMRTTDDVAVNEYEDTHAGEVAENYGSASENGDAPRPSPTPLPIENLPIQHEEIEMSVAQVQEDGEGVTTPSPDTTVTTPSAGSSTITPGTTGEDKERTAPETENHIEGNTVDNKARYDEERKRKPDETVFGEKIEDFAPLEQKTIEPGEEGYGTFLEEVQFECQPCPDEFRMFDTYNVDYEGFKWTKIEAMERKKLLDGSKSRKFHRHAGHVLKGGVFERHSAAKKYNEWRTSIIGDRKRFPGEYAKAPRRIKLIEHEPCGPKGEASKWAANINTLKNMLKLGCRGSHITLVVIVAGNQSAAEGICNEWYDAILNLLKEFPENFAVEIENESVSGVDPSTWYRKDNLAEKRKAHTIEEACRLEGYGATGHHPVDDWESYLDTVKDSNRWRHGDAAFVEYMENDRKRMMECLAQRDTINLEASRKIVDQNFAKSHKFVEDVRHFQLHGALPGEVLPGQKMPDGKVRPANVFAPSPKLFKAISKKSNTNAMSPP
ncbi:hypothetical protein K505DRAFT_364726 [Melanomma pulvis-pyrius CBS 109.77]|uniref:Uncharacterized protein n=1 Tax=Melanomma pulvis-pyrius CBS 109.77 TaxID=1314802 RepID=A0A6A6X2I6_9PLEO|nr:hypothetical protein K505DRAFT_364726 [Melanomma pulvis-pyrius CBS 109.77]